jgi:hypothetical protein
VGQALGLPAFLFALNLLFCYRLFALDWSPAVFSTDAIYISISRYAMDHWRDLSWWPIWYGGIPGSTVYPPLLHCLTALLATAEHVSVGLAHHQLSGLGYALGPVTLFLLVFRLSGSLSTSFGAGLFYTMLSPAIWLLPWARLDVGGIWRPFRLHILVGYGDAPHVFALALLPLAILALDFAVKRGTWRSAFVAVLAMAAVALTNWVGAVALAGAVLAYVLAAGSLTVTVRACGISLAAYAVSSPWLSPRNLGLVSLNSQIKSGSAAHLLEFALLVVVLMAAFKIVLQRLGAGILLQFAVFFLILPGSLPLVDAWFGVAVIPEAHRYHYETEIGVCLVLAAILIPLVERVPKPAIAAICAVAAVLVTWQSVAFWKYSRDLIRPADVLNSMEHETAMWLDANAGGSRVYARGTVSWWLNAFTDTPQLGGGVSQSIPSPANFIAEGTISGKDSDPHGDRTLMWLRAFGVDYAAVGGPHTRMVTALYEHPERFDAIGQKVWSAGGDFIYRIPRRARSLAHVIPRGAVAAQVSDVARYVVALEDPGAPPAAFTWVNAHRARVSADVPAGDVISVQVSYAPGWHASVNGVSRPVSADALGLMTVTPQASGPCIVELTFGRGVESTITAVAAVLVLVLFGFASIWEFAR